MAPAYMEELRKQLQELLESKLIWPSKAPFGAPVLFHKKDGSLRLRVDYRALNKEIEFIGHLVGKGSVRMDPSKFDFVLKYKPGRANQVANALSCKESKVFVAALSAVQGSILDEIKLALKDDLEAVSLMKRIAAGETMRLWTEDGIIYTNGNMPQDEEGKGTWNAGTSPKDDAILVVVDCFSKYATFIPTKSEVHADGVACLFMSHVAKYWGLPLDIISDRNTRFTDHFWESLFKYMGSKIKFSTSFHPRIDDQMERVNSILEEYLRHYVLVNQENWVELDATQFAHNIN
ncbi:uncharacterized protein LOC144704942 [Wolffia australiana]